jgi:hypothetical protein
MIAENLRFCNATQTVRILNILSGGSRRTQPEKKLLRSNGILGASGHRCAIFGSAGKITG